jgi:hypothetical protein
MTKEWRRLRGCHRLEAAGGWHVLGVVDILGNEHEPMQGRTQPFLLTLGIEGARLRQRLLVERDDRIELRSCAVIGLDARQVQLHQLLGSQLAFGERLLDVGYSGSR